MHSETVSEIVLGLVPNDGKFHIHWLAAAWAVLPGLEELLAALQVPVISAALSQELNLIFIMIWGLNIYEDPYPSAGSSLVASEKSCRRRCR